ncbi:MAG TPA: hypothetical protein P5086_00960 [Prolixibacteraceae bacterium]|jgi:hypothetical protein|nr:hypothetical protein [Bacteroidales bacterium]HPJ78777.1 hypothetical protein [Prolixibacteraceae bacterium]HRV87855.1 hypothetical protein [Prolixibacteraceae bacterium]
MERKKLTPVNSVSRRFIATLGFLVMMAGCQMGDSFESDFSSGEGTGGSMARFTVTGDHLYTVDHNSLKVFSLADPKKPVPKNNRNVGFDVETIFPLGNTLFLGTSTGMYIYDITLPENPQKISFYEHIYACDPVVSDGRYAYVTLSSSNARCWRAGNELQIVDIQDKVAPKQVSTHALSSPRGLAIRNDTLWVCDAGLKVFDVQNKSQIKQLVHFSDVPAFDLILNGRLALVTGEEGFVQYRIGNGTITKISEIKVIK